MILVEICDDCMKRLEGYCLYGTHRRARAALENCKECRESLEAATANTMVLMRRQVTDPNAEALITLLESEEPFTSATRETTIIVLKRLLGRD